MIFEKRLEMRSKIVKKYRRKYTKKKQFAIFAGISRKAVRFASLWNADHYNFTLYRRVSQTATVRL